MPATFMPIVTKGSLFLFASIEGSRSRRFAPVWRRFAISTDPGLGGYFLSPVQPSAISAFRCRVPGFASRGLDAGQARCAGPYGRCAGAGGGSGAAPRQLLLGERESRGGSSRPRDALGAASPAAPVERERAAPCPWGAVRKKRWARRAKAGVKHQKQPKKQGKNGLCKTGCFSFPLSGPKLPRCRPWQFP